MDEEWREGRNECEEKRSKKMKTGRHASGGEGEVCKRRREGKEKKNKWRKK